MKGYEIISQCRICDKGVEPIDTPQDACDHWKEDAEITHAIEWVAIPALDRAAGNWNTVSNLLRAAATRSFAVAATNNSDTDRRHAEACLRVIEVLEAPHP